MRAVTSVGASGLLLLALAVAACQPSSPKSTSSAATIAAPADNSANASSSALRNGKWQSTGVFDERLEAATQKMTLNAVTACMSGGSAGLMDCVTDNLVMAIDPSGNAKNHCSDQPDADARFQCAFDGTVVMNLRKKSGIEMSDSAWTNFQKSMQDELLTMAIHESFDCAKLHDPKSRAFRECMLERILTKMDAQPEMGEPCLTLETDEKFGQCVGEAGLVNLLEVAAARAI
ncbi:hypothetical protein [Dongia sp.]|uniref:hypothetical protein n=1 Tax=Dongia sp. TaxID=1977262 RepID=UPI0035B240C2